MGKQNRRRRTGRTARTDGPVLDATALSDAAQIADAIMATAVTSAQGDSVAARRFIGQLAGSGTLTQELAHGAQLASQRIITRVFQHGWLPMDVHQIARRRVDEFAVGYLTDVIAAYIQPFAPALVDETWRAQIDELAAVTWWSGSDPHLVQWANRQLLTNAEALTTVVEALALLVQLPKLELIRPLPGSARVQPAAHHGVDEKVLGRVRGLLAKAESTSFPEEAETLSAKAQELMTKYALDRVLVDADTSVPDLPGARRIWLDTPYVEAKALLVEVVTRANRCRAIFVAAWEFMTVVGDDNDLDAVELLTTSLLVQATRAMIATGNQSARSDESRSRAFRKAFLTAYATRIGERLAAANESTIAEAAEAARLLPVLASHQRTVDEAFDTLFPAVRGRSITIRSAEGWEAGLEAADRAQFKGRSAKK
ncbi:DUF2786 domain-containing protein [Nocardia sp. GCM10030253]|uniref:DUF2786 domain-containing protein n=1 Tax=Nocardia sp. GCM10030253 TaxID=3273404 RepID=UPI0036319D01